MQFICQKSISFMRQRVINVNKLCLMSTIDKTIDENSGIYDPISNEPQIPSSLRQRLESIDIKRKRLLYQSRKRGILENDLILGTFAQKYLNHFNEKELEMYDFIVNMPSNDWELYYWSVGRKPVPEEYNNEVMDLLIDHTRNKDREKRIRQPDL